MGTRQCTEKSKIKIYKQEMIALLFPRATKDQLRQLLYPENYTKYLDAKKRLLVIFRGINVDYFDPTTKLDSDEKKLLKEWQIEKDKKIILLPGRLTGWKGQEVFIEAVNLVNIELGYDALPPGT